MPTRAERLFRLEAGKRAAFAAHASIARDQAELDQRVTAIRAAGVMPDGYPIDADQEAAWAIARGMLEALPGSAEMLSRTTMVDWLC